MTMDAQDKKRGEIIAKGATDDTLDGFDRLFVACLDFPQGAC